MGFPSDPVSDGRLPLTLLSGFLGSGKTTLLKHILRNKQNMRVCVIVNDMASLNIDASLIKNSKLVQTEERLVEMQNGCICCTLREDLVVEIGALARSGQFDYLVVESTGIGEPQQTAETFTMQLQDEHGEVALSEIARLDTCVTVVDGASLLSNAASVESLAQRGEAATEEDDRNVADLLLDQLEFADVILLNKTDLIPPEEVAKLLALIKTLNPGADVIPTVQSEVDLARVIHTGRFSLEKAARSAGWLQSMQAETPHTPETIEYGIGNFIYKARKAFHPARLHEFMTKYFLLQEPDWREAMGEEEEGEEEESDSELVSYDLMQAAQESATAAAAAAQQTADALTQLGLETSSEGQNEEGNSHAPLLAAATVAAAAAAAASSAVAMLLTQLPRQQIVEEHECSHPDHHHHSHHAHSQPHVNSEPLSAHDVAAAAERRERLHSSFGQLLRAKGFAWVASRPDLCGEWSQAGGVLRFTVGGPWYAALPDEAWPQDPAQRADVLRDFEGETGDRRQELVFIGIDIKQEALVKALDACLVKDGEDVGADPFAIWPTVDQILDSGDSDEDEEESEEEDEEYLEESENEQSDEDEEEDDILSALPPSGEVLEIEEGASEVQAMLNALPSGAVALVQWHADWVVTSTAACAAVDRLAVQYPTAVVARVDVELTPANKALAMEKIMVRAQARREGAMPVLRLGAKFPAVSLHYAPNLQPAQLLTGDAALQKVAQILADNCGEGTGDPRNPEQNSTAGGRAKRATANGSAKHNGGRMNELHTGAAQFKSFLVADRDAGKDTIVIWSSSVVEPAGHEALRRTAKEAAATGHVGVIFSDLSGSKANGVLAGALGIKLLPALHIYRGMKLDKKLVGAEEVTATSILAAAGTAPAVAPAAPAATPSVPPAGSSQQPLAPQAQQHRAPSQFDPPTGKFARAGATKRMSDGRTGHFFPKMPCLRCGCPWWSSDEWNAKCLRCAWDCESQGYDDNSKPLPAFLKKWEVFTAEIKEGKTPVWKGK